MAKQVFDRSKPHVNVGTMGTLITARRRSQPLSLTCLHTLKKTFRRKLLMRSTTLRRTERGYIATTHTEYETDSRHYAHVTVLVTRLHQEYDYRSRPDGWCYSRGISRGGPMPQTYEHILLARPVNVRSW
ncbi:MAG: hypothetical protein Ct9H300mP19_20490 [Dehalococcoidia bacterium]|nr:MAG: hypothetical protein Ct9H300mP19_20490 [Dehalococcoidia bacterium]